MVGSVQAMMAAPIAQLAAITGQNISKLGGTIGNSVAGYRLNTSGIAEKRLGAAYSTIETWLLVGASSAYQCKATLLSGDAPTTGNLDTLEVLSTSREWRLSDDDPLAGGIQCELLIEIFLVSNGAFVDSAIIDLFSDYETV